MSVFLKMETQDGEVRGDVVDPAGYESQIRLQSISWDYDRAMERNRAMSVANSNGVRLSCGFGTHSVMIWKAMTESQKVSVLVTYDFSDDGDDPVLEIKIDDARLQSCNFGMSGTGGTMDLVLRFNEIELSHVPSTFTHFDTLAHNI